MSFYPVLCNYVALPDSYIKSPGAILKKVDRQVGPDCKQVQITNLFNQFKDMIGVEFNEHSPSVDLLRPRASSYTFPEPSFNEVLAHPELKPLIKFIKAKSFADEIDSVIKKTQQILGLFGVELVIKITHDHHDELFSLLKHIVTGFCFFPESLVNQLEIKYVIICDKQDQSFLKIKYSEKNSIFCPLDLETLRVHPRVSMEVNKAILSHILQQKPQIFEDWEHSLPVNSGSAPLSGVHDDFETTFLLWVKNSNNHMYKTKMDKLKKLMMKHFPTELTEEWSKTQSDERRKVQSGRISSSIGTLIAN